MAAWRSYAPARVVLGMVALSGCARPEHDGGGAGAASARASAGASTSREPAPLPGPVASQAPPSIPSVSDALRAIHLPRNASGRVPFILWLHGLGSSGHDLTQGLGVAALANEHRFAYAAPDGALDSKRRRYWNASPACCNFDRAQVDHVAELGRLVAAAREHPAVDPGRIYVIGFSNGGFMAHRLACELPGIAAIASIAGSGPSAKCAPAEPIAVVQVHGDADDVVRYGGGRALGSSELEPHASALETVRGWAKRNSCSGGPKSPPPLDINDKLAGAETVISAFGGCARPVELWTLRGGNHFAAQNRRALDAIIAFLEKQVRQ